MKTGNNKSAHLIAFQPVHDCYTDNSRLDTCMMSESCKRQGLHFDVLNSCLMDAFKVVHFVCLCEVTECTI